MVVSPRNSVIASATDKDYCQALTLRPGLKEVADMLKHLGVK
jgi:hypothetical protein